MGLIAFVLLGWVTSAAASSDDTNPPVTSLGDSTYALTRSSNFAFFRSTKKLAARARVDAAKYCATLGKQMREVSMDENKASLIYGGFSNVTIKFLALDAGDPRLTAPAPGDSAPPAGDLTKLEELHKSGILADAEFEAAQKRLAARSIEELHAKGVLTDAEFEVAKKRLAERAK